jgi:hypothetical protein
MSMFFRHCVECPKCLTRYLMAASPYGNGSLLIRTSVESDELLLYCACMQPPVLSRWTWASAIRCAISRAVYLRGYGTRQDVISAGKGTRRR